MVAVLYVCLGNICRSPAAESFLKHLARKHEILDKFTIDSCGLGDWHKGQLPDERMREAGKSRGLVMAGRAKMFKYENFDQFDYIFAADKEVLNELYKYATTAEEKGKIHLITAFSRTHKGEDVPDPYYYQDAAFDLVLDILEDSCEGFIEHLQHEHAI